MKTENKKETCPKCNYLFTPPLTRFLTFTEQQYELVIRKYSENFQICPKCKNIFNPHVFDVDAYIDKNSEVTQECPDWLRSFLIWILCLSLLLAIIVNIFE